MGRRYTLKVGGRSLGSIETDQSLGKTIGRRLQGGTPSTDVDGAGAFNRRGFETQRYDREDLREVRDILDSGGIIAELYKAKALMKFGSGATLQAEDDTLDDWLAEHFPRLDLTVIDLGMDAVAYPYTLGEWTETRGGDFGRIVPVEPWTMLPVRDQKGQLVHWEQETQWTDEPQTFRPADIGHITINRVSGRDDLGVSDVLQNKYEIEQWRENQDAIRKAVEVAGFPHNHWMVGREGQSIVDDNALRRIRNIVQRMESDSQIITGQDVEVEQFDPSTFDFGAIAEHDARILTGAIGVPIELANFGSDGLGSGMPAEFRMDMLALKNEADRRRFAVQFVEQFVRPIVREFSPFDHRQDIELQIDPFLDDKEDMAALIQQVGDYMTTDEVRDKLDLPPLDDEATAESFVTPAEQERDEQGIGDEPDGILARKLQDVGDVDTTPPQGVQDNAQMALDWREATGNPNDCGTQTGWTRANQLATGESLSEDTINRMVSFFARHDKGGDDQSREDCSRMMWKAWGGDEGQRWAEDVQSQFETARENSAPAFTAADMDAAYRDLWDHAVAVDDETTGRQLFGPFSESQTPEFVKEQLRQTILSGTLFSDFESIPPDAREDLRTTMLDTLDEDGWTIDDLTDEIVDLPGIDSEAQAETIARTETAATLNTAREEGYERLDQEDARFYWTNPLDSRTTDACEWLTEKTNPNHGGDPVPLDELKELIAEAPTHDDEMQDNLARPDQYLVHINERSTWVRHAE